MELNSLLVFKKTYPGKRRLTSVGSTSNSSWYAKNQDSSFFKRAKIGELKENSKPTMNKCGGLSVALRACRRSKKQKKAIF